MADFDFDEWVRSGLDLSADHYAHFFADGERPGGGRTGVILYHRNGDEWCIGAVNWWRRPSDNGPIWQLVSDEPLHTEPSVRCRICGDHGWIRDGRWQSA